MADKIWNGSVSTSWSGTANADNWTSSGAPATSGDTATFDGRAAREVAGSNQSATTLTRLTQFTSMAHAIGSVGTPLQVGATVVELGKATSSGASGSPGTVCLNFGSAQTTVTVYSTASSSQSGLAPVLLKGTHASNVVSVLSGAVGIADEVPGAAATIATANVLGPDARLTLSSGVTLTTLNQTAGTVVQGCAATTIDQSGGTLTTQGSGAITTASIGGTANLNATGTITNLHVESGGFADFDGGTAAITVTNAFLYGTGRIRDTRKRVTFTNGIDLLRGAKASQIDVGSDVTLTPSAV